MLRVGLTGGLSSGKTAATRRFAELGAHVLYADEIARELMQPGQEVYAQIVARFGRRVVTQDASGSEVLDRALLARIAFGDGRVEELNAIVHPATIANQAAIIEKIAERDPGAVTIVESALIFETKYGGEDGWYRRFDAIILVRADEELKIARFVARASSNRTLNDKARGALEAEARRRLAEQLDDDWKAAHSDYVLTNNGSLAELQAQVDALWPVLRDAARGPRN
jgi:dephospho-CoA kinase